MKRAVLIPFEEDHLPAVLAWVNDAELRDAIGTVRPISMAQHRSWYAGLQGDTRRLVMAISPGRNRLAGLVGLASIDLVYRNAELWVYLGSTRSRRRGFGRRAVDEMLSLAFGNLGLHRVYVNVFDFNKPAREFFKACGFREEGLLREAVFKRGKFCDKVLLGILAQEYRKGTK